MKILLCDKIIKNFTIIRDNGSIYTLENIVKDLEHTQFVFTDGSVTMKIIKKIYIDEKHSMTENGDYKISNDCRILYFKVQNLEYFQYKLRQFQNLNIEIEHLRDDETTLFDEISDFSRSENYSQYKIAVSRIKSKLKIKGDKEKEERGLALSFNPDIIRSIRSSLILPTLYLADTNDVLPSMIFNILIAEEKPLSFEDIAEKLRSSNIDGKYDSDTFENTLKSLVFCNIILFKNSLFSINELFK